MPTIQQIGSLSYNRLRLVDSLPVTLQTNYDILPSPAANQTVEDVFFDLDPAVIAQEDTITIAAGTTDDLYTVTIGDGTTTSTYTHRQTATDTADTVAASLAQVLDLHPGVRVTAATNVVTVKAVHGGEVITIDASTSSTPGNLVVASVTAPVGTPNYVKVMTITTTKELTDSGTDKGFPKVTMDVSFLDGDAVTPVQLSSKIVSSTGPRSLDTIQTNNGVIRGT